MDKSRWLMLLCSGVGVNAKFMVETVQMVSDCRDISFALVKND
jgi:hypothetical protein